MGNGLLALPDPIDLADLVQVIRVLIFNERMTPIEDSCDWIAANNMQSAIDRLL